MAVYNRISHYDHMEIGDRKQIMEEFQFLKQADSHHAIEAFVSKWNKYPDFVEYFKGKWIIENPNWHQSVSNNALESFIQHLKGMNSVLELEQCVQDWSEQSLF